MTDNPTNSEQPDPIYYVWAEYAISLRPSELASMLLNPRVRSATSKTRCNVEVTRRVLNRRQSASQWVRYSIVRITGPDDQSISQCNRLLERAVPIYQQRREYSRRAPVTLYSKNVETEGDFGIRSGDSTFAALLSGNYEGVSSHSRRRASSESETVREGLFIDVNPCEPIYLAREKTARSDANSIDLNVPVSYKLTGKECLESPLFESGEDIRNSQDFCGSVAANEDDQGREMRENNQPCDLRDVDGTLSTRDLLTAIEIVKPMKPHGFDGMGTVAELSHTRSSGVEYSEIQFTLSPNQEMERTVELSLRSDDLATQSLPRAILSLHASYSTTDQPLTGTGPVEDLREICQQTIARFDSGTPDPPRPPPAVLTVKTSYMNGLGELSVVEFGLTANDPNGVVSTSPLAISADTRPYDLAMTPAVSMFSSQHDIHKDYKTPRDLSDINGTRHVRSASEQASALNLTDKTTENPCFQNEQADPGKGSHSLYSLNEIDGGRNILTISAKSKSADCTQVGATNPMMKNSTEKHEVPCDLSEIDGSKPLRDLLNSISPGEVDRLCGTMSTNSRHYTSAIGLGRYSVPRSGEFQPSSSPHEFSRVDGSRSDIDLLIATHKQPSPEPNESRSTHLMNFTPCRQMIIEESAQDGAFTDTGETRTLSNVVKVKLSQKAMGSQQVSASVNEKFDVNAPQSSAISGINDRMTLCVDLSAEPSVFHVTGSKQEINASIEQQMALRDSELLCDPNEVDRSSGQRILSVSPHVNTDDFVVPTSTNIQPQVLTGADVSTPTHAPLAAQKAFEESCLDRGSSVSGNWIPIGGGEQRQNTRGNQIPSAFAGTLDDHVSPVAICSTPTAPSIMSTSSSMNEHVNAVAEQQMITCLTPDTFVSPSGGVLMRADDVSPPLPMLDSPQSAGMISFKLGPNQDFNKTFELPIKPPDNSDVNIPRTVVAIRATLQQSVDGAGQPTISSQGIGYDVLNDNKTMLSVDGAFIYTDPVTGEAAVPGESSRPKSMEPSFQQASLSSPNDPTFLPTSSEPQLVSNGSVNIENRYDAPCGAQSSVLEGKTLQSTHGPIVSDQSGLSGPFDQIRIERRIDIITSEHFGRNTMSMDEVVTTPLNVMGIGSRLASQPESPKVQTAALSHSPISVTASINTNLEVHVNRETGKIGFSFEVNGASMPAAPPLGVLNAPAGQALSAEWSTKLERNAIFGPIGIIPSQLVATNTR